MDIVQNTIQQANLATLLGAHLGLSLVGALASNPTYNIPIFFFGMWAYNNHESTLPLKTFTGALGFSFVLDLIWFYLHGDNVQGESGFGFAKFFNIISLLIKPLTVFVSVKSLNERGDSLNVGRWSSAPGAFPGGYENVRDADGDFV